MKLIKILSVFILCGIAFYMLIPEQPIDFNAIYKVPSESPYSRKKWDAKRLVDANGNIPQSIRRKELQFAQSLPNDLNNSNLVWTAEGPYNVGGRTRALAYDVTDENILIAGGVSGGIWRSTNLGESWSKMTKPFQLHNVTCLAQDTREGKENIWYYGTGELSGNSASGSGAYFDGNGIYKSIDNGLTWDSISSTADNSPAGSFNVFDFAWNIVLDPTNLEEDEMYLATYGGIYRSTDGGESWKEMESRLLNFVEIIKNENENKDEALIVIITHKGCLRALFPKLRNVEIGRHEEFSVDLCSISVFDTQIEKFVCIGRVKRD